MTRFFSLSTPLGKWVEPSHRKWEWYYDSKNDTLLRQTEDVARCFVRKESSRGRIWTEGPEVNEVEGLPASVRLMDNGDVKMSCTGSKMVESDMVVYETVWDILESWGASWMWEHVNKEDRNRDLSWV